MRLGEMKLYPYVVVFQLADGSRRRVPVDAANNIEAQEIALRDRVVVALKLTRQNILHVEIV